MSEIGAASDQGESSSGDSGATGILFCVVPYVYVNCDMSAAIVPRSGDMMLEWQASVHSIMAQLQTISGVQQDILSRVSALEVDGDSPHRDREWECPVCLKPFKHRSSYKGHIFRLAHPSSRPKCFLNPRNPEHVQLLDDPRFGTGEFHEKASRFVQMFWNVVHDLSSSRTTSEESLSAIQAWLQDDDSSRAVQASSASSAHDGMAPGMFTA